MSLCRLIRCFYPLYYHYMWFSSWNDFHFFVLNISLYITPFFLFFFSFTIIFIFLIQTFHYKLLLFYYSDCSKRSTSFTSSSVISFSSFCSSCSFPFSSTGDSLSIVSCMLPI